MAVSFNGESFGLKYHFVGEFSDGSSLVQNESDRSAINPQKSCFYDLLQSPKKLVKFHLCVQTSKTTGKQVLSVDLVDGHFELGDQVLWLEENPMPVERRLIFFRQHQHDFSSATREQTGHRVKYFVGWQATIKGQNVQHIIGIS